MVKNDSLPKSTKIINFRDFCENGSKIGLTHQGGAPKLALRTEVDSAECVSPVRGPSISASVVACCACGAVVCCRTSLLSSPIVCVGNQPVATLLWLWIEVRPPYCPFFYSFSAFNCSLWLWGVVFLIADSCRMLIADRRCRARYPSTSSRILSRDCQRQQTVCIDNENSKKISKRDMLMLRRKVSELVNT